jgi:hypothetical protein
MYEQHWLAARQPARWAGWLVAIVTRQTERAYNTVWKKEIPRELPPARADPEGFERGTLPV